MQVGKQQNANATDVRTQEEKKQPSGCMHAGKHNCIAPDAIHKQIRGGLANIGFG